MSPIPPNHPRENSNDHEDAALASPASGSEPSLAWQDQDTLDALVSTHWDVAPFQGEARIRAERIVDLLNTLRHYPVEASAEADERLIQSTVARIETFRQAPVAGPFAEGEGEEWAGRRAGRIDWRESLVAAACLMLLVGLSVPMLAASRERAVQQACRSNLRSAALGFAQYAADFDGALPARYAAPPDGDWLKSRANAANLLHLAKTGFVSFDTLACPNNRHRLPASRLAALDNWPSTRETSYSYQNLFVDGRHRRKWGAAAPAQLASAEGRRRVVVGDKSPVVEALHRREAAQCSDLSPCHKGGQNVLFNDGSAEWLDTAYYGDDNIWLPGDFEGDVATLSGRECPTCVDDTMLTH